MPPNLTGFQKRRPLGRISAMKATVFCAVAALASPAFGAIEISATNGVSFVAAFDKVAGIRAGDRKSDIFINVDFERIAVSRPVRIDASMQPKGSGAFVVRGVGKTRPRIFGGLPVRGWKKSKARAKGVPVAWEADVSSFGFDRQVDALFMDGRMLTLARYPNFDPGAPYAGGWAYVPGRWISMYSFPAVEPAGARDFMLVGKDDWHDWSVPSEGRITIFPRQRYSSSVVRIADLDREKRILRFAGRLCDVPRPGDTYILSGFREELDDFGEWCHDLKGAKLRLIPPHGAHMEKALVTLASTEAVFMLDGACNVAIENLELCAGTRGVRVRGGENVVVRGCSIHDMTSFAVEFHGGSRHRLVDTDIFDLGCGAVHMTGGDYAHMNGGTVENCHIHHTGKIDHKGNAIFIEGYGMKVRHCLIHDIPGWAVYHMGAFHEIADNRIHHYMLETEDGAALYTCGYMGGLGTVIARNWISDGVGFAKAAGFGPLRFFQNCHGVYFDGNPSGGPGGAAVFDNIIGPVSGMALKMNSTRCITVTNNVFYRTGRRELGQWSYAIQMTGGEYEASHADVVHQWERALAAHPELAGTPFFSCRPDAAPGNNQSWSNRLERNIWFYPECPAQQLLIHDKTDLSRHVFDFNLYCIGREAKAPHVQKTPWEDVWRRKLGQDVHSVVVDKIGFAAPARGDFTIKNAAVAKKLGLRPVNLKDCGLYTTNHRRKIEKEPDGATAHPEWFRDPSHVNPP